MDTTIRSNTAIVPKNINKLFGQFNKAEFSFTAFNCVFFFNVFMFYKTEHIWNSHYSFLADPGQDIPANEKCNITFGKPGTESATISIKLPPSVLENQAQLGSIVNTINKALTLTREVNQPGINQVLEIFLKFKFTIFTILNTDWLTGFTYLVLNRYLAALFDICLIK